ncbi:Leucoanthocyanidin dioxygenase [Spatholobus suberectus]|nr:Leucoanthocyanidin dioxygenase [Spatholobus suberectus]
MFSVKELVESNCLRSVPSDYICLKNPEESILYETENISTIDFSELTSSNPDERSKAIQQLGDACRDWGFFMLINHGVSGTIRDKMLRASQRFFDLTEEEKGEYAGRKVLDPIRYGTSFNVMVDKTLCWRDYLKCHVHPHFNVPSKPPDFSETVEEYITKSRELVRELLKGISRSLGLKENYIHKSLNVELSSQLLIVNFYPPCPEPELVISLPAHANHGLLTLVMQNELGGLQIQHNGKWIPVHALPNCFLINTGDHTEILTNGKYKSVVHRPVHQIGQGASVGQKANERAQTTEQAHEPKDKGSESLTLAKPIPSKLSEDELRDRQRRDKEMLHTMHILDKQQGERTWYDNIHPSFVVKT